jgi:hypothetical protein
MYHPSSNLVGKEVIDNRLIDQDVANRTYLKLDTR